MFNFGILVILFYINLNCCISECNEETIMTTNVGTLTKLH